MIHLHYLKKLTRPLKSALFFHSLLINTAFQDLLFFLQKKCEQYWPDEVNESVEYRDITVTMVKTPFLWNKFHI